MGEYQCHKYRPSLADDVTTFLQDSSDQDSNLMTMLLNDLHISSEEERRRMKSQVTVSLCHSHGSEQDSERDTTFIAVDSQSWFDILANVAVIQFPGPTTRPAAFLIVSTLVFPALQFTT